MRPNRDEIGLLIASAWALRGTCGRKQVGCALFDGDGYPLSAGYNGPASGQSHCDASLPCPGFGAPSGTSLHLCEAIHAEANALLRCSSIGRVRVAYVTHSPCMDCVKLLLNTGCRRIVFLARYAHDESARERWVREPYNRYFADRPGYEPRHRVWEHYRRPSHAIIELNQSARASSGDFATAR